MRSVLGFLKIGHHDLFRQEHSMTSPNTLLRAAMLASAFVAVQSPAGAGEEAASAPQTSIEQTAAIAEQRSGSGDRYDHFRSRVSAEFELVTGDGQQATPTACLAPYAECTP
jgi:hypothetical protein